MAKKPRVRARSLAFIVDLGDVGQWQALHRRVAWRTVLSYLIAAPELEKHCKAITLRLLEGDQDKIKLERTDEKTRKIGWEIRFARTISRFARDYDSSATLRQRLHFDPGAMALPKKKRTKSYGSESKAVLRTGLIVLTLDWSKRCGHPLTLSEAKEFLYHRGGEAFWGSQIGFDRSGTNAAWEEKRNVAALCAALALFVDSQAAKRASKWRRFSPSEEDALREQIVDFLGVAKWFEGVLHELRKKAHVTMKLDSRKIPKSFGINSIELGGAPTIPERFIKALDAWLASKQ